MKAEVPDTLTEITLLNEQMECLHLEERIKTTFDYPIHKHREFELNFVIDGAGLKRIVGDSIESTEFLDLALIGSELEHHWAEPAKFVHHRMREITIQFTPAIISDTIMANEAFSSIRKLFKEAKNGVAFSQPIIASVRDLLIQMTTEQSAFQRYIIFLQILHTLSEDPHKHELASDEFSQSIIATDSQRIRVATDYIQKHFREDIRLEDLARIVCMSPTSFSRFFSLRTHKSVSEYIIDHRMGYAARMLIDTRQSVMAICIASGFNNVSNFNRLFKKRKGVTPTEYRANYIAGKTYSKDPHARNLTPTHGK